MPTFPFSPNMTPTVGPTWQQTTLHATTIADLQQSQQPSTGPVCVYVEETGARYVYHQGDTTAADGWVTVADSNSAGRWRLADSYLTLTSSGSDQSARLLSAMTATAGTYSLNMNAGPWTLRAMNQIPPGTQITMEPGTDIAVSLPAIVPGDIDAPFYGGRFGATGIADATTLSVAAVAGDQSITLTSAAGYSIGDAILLDSNAGYGVWMRYTVINKVGNVLTLDRPLVRAWPIAAPGTNVYRLTANAHDIEIDGAWATISGVTGRYFEFVGAQDVVVRRFLVDGTAAVDVACGIDLGNYRVRFEDIVCSDAGTAFSLEASEQSSLSRCHAIRATNMGFALPYSDECLVEDCEAIECHESLLVGANGAGALQGNRNLTIRNHTSHGATLSGGIVTDAADGTRFEGGSFSFNGQFGIRCDATGVTGLTSHNTVMRGVRVEGNANYGVTFRSGSLNNQLVGCIVINNAAGASIESASSLDSTSTLFSDNGAMTTNALVTVTGASSRYNSTNDRFASSGGLGGTCLWVGGTGAAVVSNAVFTTVSGDACAIRNSGGTCRVSQSRVTGACGAAVLTATGQTTVLGPGVDLLSACRTYAADLIANLATAAGVSGGTTFGNVGNGTLTVEVVYKSMATSGGATWGIGGLHDGTAFPLATFVQFNNDLVALVRNGAGVFQTVTWANAFVNQYGRYLMLHLVLDGAGNILAYRDGALLSSQVVAYNLNNAGNAVIFTVNGVANTGAGVRLQQEKIWTRALSATEIQQRYEEDYNTATARTNLEAEYFLTAGAGVTAADTSGNVRTMALAGGYGWDTDPWQWNPIRGLGLTDLALEDSITVFSMAANRAEEATYAQYRNKVINFTGAMLQANDVYWPAGVVGVWFINQATAGGFNVTLKTPGTAGTAFAAGVSRFYSDGTTITAI